MALSLCLIMPFLLSQQVRPCRFSTCSNAACCCTIFNHSFVQYQASITRHLLYSLRALSCPAQPSTCLRTYLSTCLLSGARGVTHSTAENERVRSEPPLKPLRSSRPQSYYIFQRIDLCSALSSARPFDSKQGLRRLDPRPSHRALVMDQMLPSV